MCFMEIKSDNEVLSSNDESDLSYNELYNAFESLYDEFKKVINIVHWKRVMQVYLLKKMHWKRKHELLLIVTRLTNLKRKIRL